MSGFSLIPLAFTAIGVLFAVLGVRNQRAGSRFTRTAGAASAQVTDLRSRSIGHGADSSIATSPWCSGSASSPCSRRSATPCREPRLDESAMTLTAESPG